MLSDFFGVNLSYQENMLAKYYTQNGHQVVVIASTIESIFDYMQNKYERSTPKKHNNPIRKLQNHTPSLSLQHSKQTEKA